MKRKKKSIRSPSGLKEGNQEWPMSRGRGDKPLIPIPAVFGNCILSNSFMSLSFKGNETINNYIMDTVCFRVSQSMK